MVMIESEGITEEVETWRTDVVATIVHELGLGRVMFEAADRQPVQLECLRRGIWGTKSVWGRVLTYESEEDEQS